MLVASSDAMRRFPETFRTRQQSARKIVFRVDCIAREVAGERRFTRVDMDVEFVWLVLQEAAVFFRL
jgi:hypothetical protein